MFSSDPLYGKHLEMRLYHKSSCLFCCLNEISQNTEKLTNTHILPVHISFHSDFMGVQLPGCIGSGGFGHTAGSRDLQA